MEQIIFHAHEGFAYLIILAIALFLIALFTVMFSYSGKITKQLRKSTLITMILFHTQFLIGLLMLFVASPFMSIVKSSGMGEIMKTGVYRFQYVEHPFSMLVAAILMTIVNKKVKSNERLTLKIVFIALLAIALVMMMMPWSKLFP
ncbi:hypothetical protein [Riemerella columbipharyngis]|uniref:50S ribosomal protein L27 n=1 Tax=Riemerella columbipharyngis TaxID=1071918 RepID=A0A1G7A7P6_9FLAO|nr:hypothetical protein [Riemerella columbipharyngis]SDE10904.1 hypothetical protein SAMN05421544_10386 [Riemerella columbipharyngis]